jgi:hypothetical protein
MGSVNKVLKKIGSPFNNKPTKNQRMKFQTGNKLAKGGKRNPPGGRPTKEQQEIKKEAAQIAREFFETHVQGFLDSYLDLGTGKVIERLDKDGNIVKLVMLDPATVRHAIDKILPDEQMELTRPMVVQFLQFARNHNPAQLPAEELPAPILVGSNGNEDEAGRQGAAPTLKFHDFSNGKRR